MATKSLTWLFRKAHQVGEGGFRWRTMYLSTVDYANGIPILGSSPTIRGEPQIGLAIDILRTRSRISTEIAGRPGLGLRLTRAQCSRYFLRRHSTTVAGRTNSRGSFQSGQIRDSQAQRIQSAGLSRGRFTDRWSKTPYVVTVKDVPVDGFWSITVYNKAVNRRRRVEPISKLF